MQEMPVPTARANGLLFSPSTPNSLTARYFLKSTCGITEASRSSGICHHHAGSWFQLLFVPCCTHQRPCLPGQVPPITKYLYFHPKLQGHGPAWAPETTDMPGQTAVLRAGGTSLGMVLQRDSRNPTGSCPRSMKDQQSYFRTICISPCTLSCTSWKAQKGALT